MYFETWFMIVVSYNGCIMTLVKSLYAYLVKLKLLMSSIIMFFSSSETWSMMLLICTHMHNLVLVE